MSPKRKLNNKVHPADEAHNNSFYKSFGPVIVVAQIFGLLPVNGISGSNPKCLKFQWKSFRTIYSLCIMLIVSLMTVMTIFDKINNGITYESFDDIVFFINALLSSYYFLKLAINWSDINEFWYQTEVRMVEYGFPDRMSRRVKMHLIIFGLLALGDHSLSRAKIFFKLYICSESTTTPEFGTFFKAFSSWKNAFVFDYIPYNPFFGIIFLLGRTVGTFNWSFTNLFLAIISLQLTARFKQINRRINEMSTKNMSEVFWRKTREDFNLLARLTRKVDENTTQLILLAFALNIYYICLQLSKGLKSNLNMYQSLYFFFSLGFLLYRTGLVALCASSIYVESKQPILALQGVSEEFYGKEVKRFLGQVIHDDIVLSGCGFFSVTRTLLLSITSTIVTYEVVLVQANANKTEETWSDVNRTFCESF